MPLSTSAQTNEFSYQGSLQNGGTAANGNFDFEFRLFDAVAAGGQIGPTLTRNGVSVTAGVFSVNLDFGLVFLSGERYLQIGVRPAGGGGYTTLAPRQRISTAPYAFKAQIAQTANGATNAATATNALQLGGVAANQYLTIASGNTNYIQNQSAGAQASSNFNISGNGTAGGTLSGNIVSAATQFNISADKVLSTPGSNTFVGKTAGLLYSSGDSNTFVGNRAAEGFVFPINASRNSAFGSRAGLSLTTGWSNSLFGEFAGANTREGEANTFIGSGAGQGNTSGSFNTFVGGFTGATGEDNSSGTHNTFLGYGVQFGAEPLSYATAIGSGAIVSNSNSIVLGRPGGVDTVRIPGATMMGGNLVVASGNLAVFNSPVSLVSLSTGGATALCRNASTNFISTCSSSLRYKTNINRFSFGLDLIKQLKPITFDWKDGGMKDFGLGAENVAVIEPLLVTYNAKGEVEGVKYDRIGVVLINAVKEQQSQIEAQKTTIEEQQKRIASLERAVCRIDAELDLCATKEQPK
jgi:hypothetical protein